ncbi:MAG: helix-turn-helix transcriptional regulator [Holophagales bacterium]|nr:helix-turn-helix transcriptional regulator [Holophagales bacterium]
MIREALGLTPAQGRVAVWLAEGRTVREIAEATDSKEASVYWHVRQIYNRMGISRQADLVRLVLSVPDWS